MTEEIRPLTIKWEDSPRDGALRGEGREGFTDKNGKPWNAFWSIAIYPAQSGWNVTLEAAGFAMRAPECSERKYEPYRLDTRVGRGDYSGLYPTLEDAKAGAETLIEAAHTEDGTSWYWSS